MMSPGRNFRAYFYNNNKINTTANHSPTDLILSAGFSLPPKIQKYNIHMNLSRELDYWNFKCFFIFFILEIHVPKYVFLDWKIMEPCNYGTQTCLVEILPNQEILWETGSQTRRILMPKQEILGRFYRVFKGFLRGLSHFLHHFFT